MTRRTIRQDRRRYAILGLIAEKGDTSARTIADTLRFHIMDVIHELWMLEQQGRVTSERVMPLTGTAPSRIYQLPNRRSAR